ncbi:hypothetical protein DEO72_LG4g388 [Vigna unguiculata]|uniref:Uncharacterized protein n=1 Tax=Vigna unguiculata TaxID=3917 RepID=A0A4D6LN38_VIGUN|nr:hypothetical protein DEO72_LG4g388 [Vigna unguiculata]
MRRPTVFYVSPGGIEWLAVIGMLNRIGVFNGKPSKATGVGSCGKLEMSITIGYNVMDYCMYRFTGMGFVPGWSVLFNCL